MDWLNAPPLAEASDLATLTKASDTNPKLVLALKRASNRFRGAVGHFVSFVSDDVVLLDGDGSYSLLLPAAPIVGSVTVKVDGLAVTDFSISRRKAILRRSSPWPDALENIEVQFSHGYQNIPGDIQDAVLEQAELQYALLAGVQQASLGAQSVTFGAQATVGVTQRWTDAVAHHELRGSRS
jgi:hypothetical protein